MSELRQPLPERLRPASLSEILGQDHLLGSEGLVTRFLEAGHLPSLLIWGPPGCGKTTMARLLAQELGLHFQALSAVLDGVGELRKQVAEAQQRATFQGTLLFIDEIHRFSKAQQDALLPHVENGTVILVGATTENPSFSVTAALSSRCRTFALRALDGAALAELVARCQRHPEGLPGLQLADDAAMDALSRLSAGDGRRALLLMQEAVALSAGAPLSAALLMEVSQGVVAHHDKAGEAHYDVASAFIKSMRASDVQAALFYLARQLEAGEDPRFVARRVLIFASEDVGLADPQALVQASAAFQAVSVLGMPEAVYPLSQAVIYCATAPKSNSAKGYFAAAEALRRHPGARVPLHLRNAPTDLMKDMGYGAGYQYDHDCPDHFAGQACLPEELLGSEFYVPGQFGHEREIAKRLQWWRSRAATMQDKQQ